MASCQFIWMTHTERPCHIVGSHNAFLLTLLACATVTHNGGGVYLALQYRSYTSA